MFIGTLGGSWEANVTEGDKKSPCTIDNSGQVTVAQAGTVRVGYSNSGGTAAITFVVADFTAGQEEPPNYNGSLGSLSVFGDDPISIAAGAAFSGDNLAFSATGLPTGLTIDGVTGRIYGQTGETGSYYVIVVATNTAGAESGTFQLEINRKQISPSAPVYDGTFGAATVTVGTPFGFAAGAAFSGETLTFSAAGLPPALVVDAATGDITGTPSIAGDFSIIVKATNAGGSASGTFLVAVTKSTSTAPSYDGSLRDVEATVGAAFTLDAGEAFVGNGLTFVADGLAPGLEIDPASGRITGTPTAEGLFATTITAKNSTGEVGGTLRIVITKSGTATPAPTYAGGLTDKTYDNDIEAQTYDVAPFFSNIAAGAWSVSSAPAITSGLWIDQKGIVTIEPLPLPEGVWTITATFDDGTNPPANGSFQLTITAAGQVGGTPETALDYDGLAPKSLGPTDLPYDFSQHISGPGPVTYSAKGLPAGVTIGATTGTISDSSSFTGTTTATIIAGNGTLPDIGVAIGFGEVAGDGLGGSEPVASGSAKAASHDLVTEANSGTLEIGAQDSGSRVWATVMVGGTEDAGFVVSDASAVVSETQVPVAKRSLQLVEITGTSGSTVPATWAAKPKAWRPTAPRASALEAGEQWNIAVRQPATRMALLFP